MVSVVAASSSTACPKSPRRDQATALKVSAEIPSSAAPSHSSSALAPTPDGGRPVGGNALGSDRRELRAESAEDREAVPLVLLDQSPALVHQLGHLTVDPQDAPVQLLERLTVGIHGGRVTLQRRLPWVNGRRDAVSWHSLSGSRRVTERAAGFTPPAWPSDHFAVVAEVSM